jgi:hypothetical protein
LLAAVAAGCGSSSPQGTPDSGGGGDSATHKEGGGTDGGDGVIGNVLISDQYNNRVIEVTRAGKIVFTYGDGKGVPGPTSVVAPNDAERLPSGETLISGTGTPAGTEPACPMSKGTAGCPDNRVLIVDSSGKIAWQYGTDGGASGSGSDQLNVPAAATYVHTSSGDHVLIVDQGNNRIIEVDRTSKKIVWTFPPAGSKATLNSPNSVERETNGNTLISDESGGRVIDVKADGTVVFQYPEKLDKATLNAPAFASRLPDGDILITDAGNNQIIEIDSSNPPKVVFSYSTADRNPKMKNPAPTRAVRLKDGHTLISDQFNEQIIEIDAQKNIVYTYGKLGVAGAGAGELNGPYDAKVVGDFTGLTDPGAVSP